MEEEIRAFLRGKIGMSIMMFYVKTTGMEGLPRDERDAKANQILEEEVDEWLHSLEKKSWIIVPKEPAFPPIV